jgi:argininosuccinate lyase
MAIQLLYTRNQLLFIMKTLSDLQNVILQLASEHVETVMPGYTHLQHAQPWTFGHYILGYFYQFDRSFERLKGAFSRTNLNPLGTAALTGSSWPLNRERTRDLLGFDGLMEHSKDAGAFTPDFILEVIAHCSIIMWQLSLIFSDLYIWTTHEFDMVSPDPSYCGTSSIMPQKKNPYSIEAILSAAGLATGWLPAALGSLRMMSSTAAFWAYGGRRLHIFEIFKILTESLELSSGTLQTLDLNTELMKERAGAFWSTATELADTIAKEKQLAFRVAHQIVGRLVAQSVQDGISPSEVSAKEVDAASKEITGKALELSDDIIKRALDPMNLIKNRVTAGSVSPEETKSMILDCRKQLANQEAWLDDTLNRIKYAETKLKDSVKKIVEESN